MEIWTKAKTADKGIEKFFVDSGVEYRSLPELGNLFLDYPDWAARYRELLARAGELLMERLVTLPVPFCLMCTERKAAECHNGALLGVVGHSARSSSWRSRRF